MEVRDFFTPDEIEEMKKRIISGVQRAFYLITSEQEDEDGYVFKTTEVSSHIRMAIEDAIKKEVQGYIDKEVKRILHEVVKENVEAATSRFTKNLCDQLDKITQKTNWYWSIK